MLLRVFAPALVLLNIAVPVFGGNSSANFGGIGVDGVPQDDGQIVVRQLVTGGPAHTAGIRNGDIITRIDGKPTRGSDFRKMVEYRLRGQAGTKVLLTIQRPGNPKPIILTLIRRQLLLPRKESK